MTWVTTADVGHFLSHAESLLAADPVANSVLLTEARFWSRLSVPEAGARFGWWSEDGRARAAFVHIPDHSVLCSPLTAASAKSLPLVLEREARVGVHGDDAQVVVAAWRAQGRQLRRVARLSVLELHHFRPQPSPEGNARPAEARDLPLLRSWFALFRERHREDASHVEFVIEHPVEEGALVIWEVDGEPVAMASRTPVVAGMTRMGLAFQPAEGTTYVDAAFDAACVAAQSANDHVLVLSGNDEATVAYESRGFEPLLHRVVLEPSGS